MAKKNELKKIDSQDQEVTKYDFIICPNCGAEEVGKFCPNCGQSNKDFNKPIKEIFGDLLDSINLDIRLLNTLIPFFIKPGFLAQEYFKGKRKRYVPPMRMYMFVSIIFFFLIQYVDNDQLKENILNLDNDPSKNISVSLNNNLSQDSLYNIEGISEEVNDTAKNSEVITLANFGEQDLEKMKQDVLEDTTSTDAEKEIAIGGINAYEKKDLFFNKFMKNISYVLFLLMPFFGLILALILWRSKKLYVHHLIFSINFHAFIFGLSSVIIILGEILSEKIYGTIMYLWWGIPLYLMFGIRRYYNRKYIGSFFKSLGALSLYGFVISIVIVLLLVFTVKGFYEV
jgi:uncharacterized protein DUF3667